MNRNTFLIFYQQQTFPYVNLCVALFQDVSDQPVFCFLFPILTAMLGGHRLIQFLYQSLCAELQALQIL